MWLKLVLQYKLAYARLAILVGLFSICNISWHLLVWLNLLMFDISNFNWLMLVLQYYLANVQ